MDIMKKLTVVILYQLVYDTTKLGSIPSEIPLLVLRPATGLACGGLPRNSAAAASSNVRPG